MEIKPTRQLTTLTCTPSWMAVHSWHIQKTFCGIRGRGKEGKTKGGIERITFSSTSSIPLFELFIYLPICLF